jgi:trimeric autotransporter adhesin
MATGWQALFHNTTGNDNTATGFEALDRNTTGTQNTATGSDALQANTTGNSNTADGLIRSSTTRAATAMWLPVIGRS